MQFFKTYEAYLLVLKGNSLLKIHGLSIENSLEKGILICVCEDTTMWHIPNVQVAKLHSSYLVSFDASTAIGVTSRNMVFCNNVQCDKKFNSLIQCDMKMVQCDSML